MITYSYNQIINFVCETNRLAKAEIYCFSTDIFFTRPQIHSKSQLIRALTFFNCSSLFRWIHKQLMGSRRKQLNRRGKMSGIIINQFYAGKFLRHVSLKMSVIFHRIWEKRPTFQKNFKWNFCFSLLLLQ